MFDNQLFFDGAMGTMLQKGFTAAEAHQQYIEAGADILTSNTFGIFDARTIEETVGQMKNEIGKSKLIAFDIGPTGRLLEPYGDLTPEECYEIFLGAAKAGSAAGADLILIETMTDLEELKAAVTAAKTTGLPVVATMTFDKSGRTMMGSTLRDMALLLESLRVDVMGMNCGYGPELYEELLPELAALTNLPILVQPNAGLPELVNGEPYYSMTPEEFGRAMARMSGQAKLLGGCCGTTPAHIKEMVALCRR